jgi:hypothetical protein
MLFIETRVFTRAVTALITSDDEYRALQAAIALRPDAGTLIKGAGGLRKLRWADRDKGKRGGLRIIYHWDRARARVYLLFAYRKSRRDDLDPAQVRLLRKLVRENLE